MHTHIHTHTHTHVAWVYTTLKTDLIRTEWLNTNWQSLFLCINAKGLSLVWGIFSRHISNKIITCNNRDAPSITLPFDVILEFIYRKLVKLGRNPNDNAKVREVQYSTNIHFYVKAKHTLWQICNAKFTIMAQCFTWCYLQNQGINTYINVTNYLNIYSINIIKT